MNTYQDDNLIITYEIEKHNDILSITIYPFIYKDGRNPRLPRKRSNGYNLKDDTNSFFKYAFSEVENMFSDTAKYSVQIIIYKGNDGLGSADLDNYSKAILDGITSTHKVWKDDKQVDKLVLERIYYDDYKSRILLKINTIQ